MAKAGTEIEKVKTFLDQNTFIAYLLGKKNSGKGTYTKLMIEIFGTERIGHISVGDVVRSVHKEIADNVKRQELIDYLQKNYRGYISVDQAMAALEGRDTKTLLPTEFILTLVKREIDRLPKKTLFIDGFPRDLNQVSYSLYFRDLINYRDDQDVFVLISIPETIIDERMKNRVVCPICNTPRSLKLLRTKEVGYDPATKEFYLICDNSECKGARMKAKEGDNMGIETIRERLKLDEGLIKRALNLYGIPKILLRNDVPANQAKDLFDDYELTPGYFYQLDKQGRPEVLEKPWIVKNEQGVDSYSLLAPPVVVSWIKQLVKVFGL